GIPGRTFLHAAAHELSILSFTLSVSRRKNMRTLYTALFVFIASASALAQKAPPKETAMDRFLRYVKIDTQSAEDQPAPPSTKKQLDLARLLEKELKDLSVQNVRLSEWGIVYGMVPGNLADNGKVPTIGFIAHMDTSPSVSGA